MYASGEVAKLTGLSMERCRQYARDHKLVKVGSNFLWTQEDIDGIMAKKGKVGNKHPEPRKPKETEV